MTSAMSTPLTDAPARRSHRRLALRLLLLLVGGALLSFAYYTATYFYATHLGNSIPNLHPLSRSVLESRLHFYITREILPRDSMWGRSYQLAPGEHMQQYLIGGLHPLDVVYDEHGHVQAIFESYE